MLLKPKDFHNKIEENHIYQSNSYDIYQSLLANIYCSRFKWRSTFLKEEDLRNIEEYLFLDNHCVICRLPRRVSDKLVVYNEWGVYRVSNIYYDRNQNVPLRVMVANEVNPMPVYRGSFILIKDYFSAQMPRVSTSIIAQEYSARLSKIDAMINTHTNKQRLPIVARANKRFFNSIKNVIRDAMGGGFWSAIDNSYAEAGERPLFENPEINYYLNEMAETKDRVLQEYCSVLGIENTQDYNKSGVYVNEHDSRRSAKFVKNVALMQLKNRENVYNKELAKFIGLKVERLGEEEVENASA